MKNKKMKVFGALALLVNSASTGPPTCIHAGVTEDACLFTPTNLNLQYDGSATPGATTSYSFQANNLESNSFSSSNGFIWKAVENDPFNCVGEATYGCIHQAISQ